MVFPARSGESLPRRVQAALKRWVRRGTDVESPDDASLAMRANVFLLVGWVGLTINLIPAIVLGAFWNTLSLLSGVPLFVWARWSVVRAHRPHLAANIGLAAAAWLFITGAFTDGQAHSMSLWMLGVLPLVAAYLCGVRVAVRWAVFAGVATIFVVLSPHFFVVPQELPSDTFNLIVNRFTVLGLVAAFAIAARVQSDRQVAELRSKQADLEAARAHAEEASRLKSEFLANMSHEIRTPMNGMLGMVELLQSGHLSTDQREIAGTIRSSGEALLAIINDVLDFSKIEAGRLEIETVQVEIRRLLEEVASLFGEASATAGLELVVRVAPEVPHSVAGDPTRIRQVLANLIGNAVKFTHKGQVVASVEAGPSAGDGRCKLRFAVADTGIGIPEEAAATLFEAFRQVDGSTTRRYGGTGLGLTICSQLAQLLGGSLTFESQVDVGTTFWFEVELDVIEQSRPLDGLEEVFEGRSVVVVDAAAATREAVSELLEGWGLDVVAASSADEGADLLLSDPSIVAAVADEVAGASDSWRIRPSSGCVPLVVMHPIGAPPAGDRAKMASVAKPVRASQLRAALGGLLGGRPLAEESEGESFEGLRARVLVAEDNAVNQRIAVRHLERFGCEVEVVSDGAQAVEMAQRRNFDIVLMDCHMPNMDGFEATAELRRSFGAQLPIVAVTASVTADDEAMCRGVGMDAMLAKPYTAEMLAAVVRRWARRLDPEVSAIPEDAWASRPTPARAE